MNVILILLAAMVVLILGCLLIIAVALPNIMGNIKNARKVAANKAK